MSSKIAELTKWYSEQVFQEMENRGYDKDEIPRIIAKTGFERVLREYPEEQLHDSISDAVDEIIYVAAAA